MTPRHELRYHTREDCFCCGRANPHSMGMRIFTRADGLEAEVSMTWAHEGSHGNAHGGAIAALFDELIGCLASHLDMPAVTANLSVDFRAPVPLPAALTMRAQCDSVEGRKLWVSAQMFLDSRLVAEARGLWIRRPEAAQPLTR